MKRLFKGLFCLLVLVFTFTLVSFNVKALSTIESPKIEVLGARIRTTGKQGLRFEAKIDSLDGVTEHGFYISIGRHSKNDFLEAINNKTNLIGSNNVVKKPVAGTNLNFNAVIIDIPQENYKDDISTIAYAVKNGENYYSEVEITRSIAEVAIALYQKGNQDEFIKNIYDLTTKLVGPNETYTTINEAMSAASDGDTIILANGNYSETVNIDKNNIDIVSANRFIDPNSDAVITEEATFDGQFVIADNIKNINIEGLKFINSGSIQTAKGLQENITIKNCIFDQKDSSMESPIISELGSINGLNLLNNKAINIKSQRFLQSPSDNSFVTNINISNNKFSSFGTSKYSMFDWFRFNNIVKGNVEIINNEFNKATQTAFNIQHHDKGNYIIKNNKFNNISGAVMDIRDFKDANTDYTKSNFVIEHNIFDNRNGLVDSWGGALRFSLNNYTREKISLIIDYNKFFNWKLDILDRRNGILTEIVDMNKNYIDSITTMGIDDSAFGNLASNYDNLCPTEEDFDKGCLGNYKENLIYVGTSQTITTNIYPTLTEAIKNSKGGEKIIVLPGTYKENITINKNNLTITTNNALINPNEELRNNEVIFDGTITIDKRIINTKIDGFKFVGQTRFVLNNDATVEKNGDNIQGFTLKNNIIESTLTTNPFIEMGTSVGDVYCRGINLINNKFNAGSFTGNNFIYLNNTKNLKFIGNTFTNITATENTIFINDSGKGMSGEYNFIKNNKFEKITGNAFNANYASPLSNGSDPIIKINNNIFNEVNGFAIRVGKPNNSDTFALFDVSYNEFTKVNSGIYLLRVGSTFNNYVNNNVFNDECTTFYIKVDELKSKEDPSYKLDAQKNIYYENGVITANPNDTKFIGKIDYSNALLEDPNPNN